MLARALRSQLDQNVLANQLGFYPRFYATRSHF
jgi:hypothetical protein